MASAWWRHQMETFSALLAFCAGNSPVNGEFPAQRPVTRSFDVFFDLGLNRQLSKQWRRRWFETPSRSLWCHCNGYIYNGLRCSLPYTFISNKLNTPCNDRYLRTHRVRWGKETYQTSNISRTLVSNKIVDHSEVVGTSPVSAAPTTSSFSTSHLASTDWAKTTAWRDERHLSYGIWSVLYWRFDG